MEMQEMFVLTDVVPIEAMECFTMAAVSDTMEHKLETMAAEMATISAGTLVVVDAMWVLIDVLTLRARVKVSSMRLNR